MNRTLVITISGSSSGCGKTSLAERLIPCLASCAAVKAHVEETSEFSIVAEESPSESPPKDTARFLRAGARRAYLVHGPAKRAAEAVREIFREGEFAALVVESNALARLLDADLAFFVEGGGEEKPGADVCRERADIIVAGSRENRRTDNMFTSKEAEIVVELKRAAVDGRIACQDALAIGRRLGVESREIGAAADVLGLKISTCQLGCF